MPNLSEATISASIFRHMVPEKQKNPLAVAAAVCEISQGGILAEGPLPVSEVRINSQLLDLQEEELQRQKEELE